jgi:hypothetical protein
MLKWYNNFLLYAPQRSSFIHLKVLGTNMVGIQFIDLSYAFQKLASKHVVGWHVMATIAEDLITTSLQLVFLTKEPALGY